MKLKVLILTFLLAIPSLAGAQNFQFDMIRTQSAPGFFMVRIFPGQDNLPLPIKNIFVKNFEKPQDEQNYKGISSLITESGGIIIEKSALSQYAADPFIRVIYMGQKGDSGLNFQIQDTEKSVTEFQEFSKTNLAPLYLKDLSLDFGGNIHDVLPSKLPDAGEEPIFFVGKFDREMKTRLEVRGLSFDGELRATQILNIDDASLSAQDPLAEQIPDIWEELWNAEHQPPVVEKPATNPAESFLKKASENAFPVVLFGLGILFFVLFLRQMRKRVSVFEQNPFIDLSEDENMESVPFEIEKRNKSFISERPTTPDVPISLVSRKPQTPPFLKTENKNTREQSQSSKAQR